MARVELGCEINKLYSVCDERGNTNKYDEVPISKVFELFPKILQLVVRNKISRKKTSGADLHVDNSKARMLLSRFAFELFRVMQ